MLSAGTQSSLSSNWKPALVASKRAHNSSEIRKVTTEVSRAALLQLRSTASFGPLTIRQKSAPTSGRKVTTERIGQLTIGPYLAASMNQVTRAATPTSITKA